MDDLGKVEVLPSRYFHSMGKSDKNSYYLPRAEAKRNLMHCRPYSHCPESISSVLCLKFHLYFRSFVFLVSERGVLWLEILKDAGLEGQKER